MRENQFLIKYRYANSASYQTNNNSNEQDENVQQYEQYAIDLSEEINQQNLSLLTYEYIIQTLKDDFANFNETNVKIWEPHGSEMCWMKLNSDFQIDFELIDEQDWMYNGISLLLEKTTHNHSATHNNAVKNTNEIKQNSNNNDAILSYNFDRISGQIETIDIQQQQLVNYIASELDARVQQTVEDAIQNSSEDKLIRVVQDSLRQYFDVFESNIEQSMRNILSGLIPQMLQSQSHNNNNNNNNNNYHTINEYGNSNNNHAQEKNWNQNTGDPLNLRNPMIFENQSFQNIQVRSSLISNSRQGLNAQNSLEIKEKDGFFLHIPKQQSIIGESSAIFMNTEGQQNEDQENDINGQHNNESNTKKDEKSINITIDGKDNMITSEDLQIKTIDNSSSNGNIKQQTSAQDPSQSNTNIIITIPQQQQQQEQPQQQQQQQVPSMFPLNNDNDDSNDPPLFKFNLGEDVDTSKEQQTQGTSGTFKPIMFQLPSEESDSPEVDFFKSVKKTNKDKKSLEQQQQQQQQQQQKQQQQQQVILQQDTRSDIESSSNTKLPTKSEINSAQLKKPSNNGTTISATSSGIQSSPHIKGLVAESSSLSVSNPQGYLHVSNSPRLSGFATTKNALNNGKNNSNMPKSFQDGSNNISNSAILPVGSDKKIGNNIHHYNNGNDHQINQKPGSQSQRKIQLLNSTNNSTSVGPFSRVNNNISSPRGSFFDNAIPKVQGNNSKSSLRESISELRGLNPHDSMSVIGGSTSSQTGSKLELRAGSILDSKKLATNLSRQIKLSAENNNSSSANKTNNVTDMTIMYSEPIVKASGQNVYVPAGDPVDFELEIQKLNEFLNETNKQIKLDVVVASLDNLEKAITRNSQILHIMCHGDYSEKDQNYYLAFEDEESKLDPVTSKRFQEFFKNKNSNVKLVFFNACHSEEVGKIFQEAGVPFVIAVQSDLKIEDKAALTFSSSFYMNVFSGHSVEESFESAKSSLQAKQHDSCFTCCCAHSHDDNCSWFIEAMNGFNSAHEQHKPDARCKCPNAKKLYHEYMCEWAHEFLNKYRDDYEEYIENLSGNELFVCCCHTPKTPHDESLKFRLIKNKCQDDCKLMMDLPEGSIIQKCNLDFNHPIFQDQSKIFGRSLDVFKMYRWLMINQKLKTKFVALNGELGSGKTAVAKKVARHLRERGQVTDIILEDFEKMKTKITKFEQKMRLNQHTKELAYNILKTTKTLFILDNCDDLIKNNKSKFEQTLNDLSLNTPAKFIIISHEKHDLKVGQGPVLQITLGELNEFCVKQLIEFYAGESIRENSSSNPQFCQQLQELIKIMPKSPKTIMETVQNITENMDITQILNSFKDCKVSEKSKDFAAFNLLLKELKVTNQPAYEMLLLISLFPHGVTVEDLKFLEKHKKIPHDWVKIMLSLTEFKNESQISSTTNRPNPELLSSTNELADLGASGNTLKRMQSKKINKCGDDENLEEDDYDNDAQLEESYQFKKFKNGQYFWMGVTRKSDIVMFKIKKFVVQQLKQPDYREDLFPKEMLILEYLSTFAKRLLRHLKDKSHHEEKIIEYCSLSLSGIFGLHFSQHSQHGSSSTNNNPLGKPTDQLINSHSKNIRSASRHPTIENNSIINPAQLTKDQQTNNTNQTTASVPGATSHSHGNKSVGILLKQDIDSSSSDNNEDDDGDEDSDHPTRLTGVQLSSQQSQMNKNFSEDIRKNLRRKDSVHPEKAGFDNIDLNIFETLQVSEIFKIHEGNFYSYLNVEDHKQLIAYVNSKACNEKKKQKIKRNIQDLCVNIPSIHKLLDEISTSEEQCQQAEQVLDELLKNTQNSQFLLPKAKLLFIKISLYVDKFVSDGQGTIEDVIHFDEIEGMQDEIDKKFTDFDKNEVFTELIDIEKQFIVYYLLYQSYRINKECEQSHVYEVVLKLSKESSRLCGVKQRITQLLENLIPELLTRVQALRLKDKALEDSKKDIKFNASSLDILESKIHLLNGLIELEFNRIQRTNFEKLEKAIQIFEKCCLHSLMIQTTMVYCSKRLFALKSSRETLPLIKLKKELIDPAIVASKQWKLTSLEADCKKILGEINDKLHAISSNVFQFMKACPLMMDKNTSYGHIIRLNQSFKKRITDVLSKQGKELNLKFEIQTIKHFRECLQRGSKFVSISCDEYEEDGIVVEDDQLPLLRKYKEQEMEEYYKQHYEELGQIEILMLCSPNGIKLKEMFARIIEKVNTAIKKMQDNPDLLHKLSDVPEKESIVAGDSELRRNPTIIAFQFKPTGQKQFQSLNVRTEKRKQTILQNKQMQQAQQSHQGGKADHSQQNKQQRKGKKGDENSQAGNNQNTAGTSDDNIMNDFDDFYLFYLKEFATQQFQFEFVTQLLQDKSEANPQAHIKKAFNLAQQKMVTETIRICGEDIKDEQTFEQILGKGPQLFLSDSWKDAKYEFKKGQIIDITSERPPQNLNRNFLRISGRKQDIFILLQKIQENSVNIFGASGIGKTIVAQQLAYFTFSRNTFSDGVYYFSMKELANFNYDLKQYMESLLGLQFGQDIRGYFQSQKNVLLIFDDFDIVVSSQQQQQNQQEQPKIQYFEFIFSYINMYDIHYVLITNKSLRHVLTNSKQPQNNNNSSPYHLKPNMYYHEIKQFSRKEALNFLDSLLDLEQINIRNILENRKKFLKIYQKAQGHPKRLIEEYCLKFGNPKIPQQFKVIYNQHCESELQLAPSVSPSPFMGVQQQGNLQKTQNGSGFNGTSSNLYSMISQRNNNKKGYLNSNNSASNRDLSSMSAQTQNIPSLSAISQVSNSYNNNPSNPQMHGSLRQPYFQSPSNEYSHQYSMDSSLPNSQVFNRNSSKHGNAMNSSNNHKNNPNTSNFFMSPSNPYPGQQSYLHTQATSHSSVRGKNQVSEFINRNLKNKQQKSRNYSSHSYRNQPTNRHILKMSMDEMEDSSYSRNNQNSKSSLKQTSQSMIQSSFPQQPITPQGSNEFMRHSDRLEMNQYEQKKNNVHHSSYSTSYQQSVQDQEEQGYLQYLSQEAANSVEQYEGQSFGQSNQQQHLNHHKESCHQEHLAQMASVQYPEGLPKKTGNKGKQGISAKRTFSVEDEEAFFTESRRDLDEMNPSSSSAAIGNNLPLHLSTDHSHSSSVLKQPSLLNLNSSMHQNSKKLRKSGIKSKISDKHNNDTSYLSGQQQHSFYLCEEDFQDDFADQNIPSCNNNYDFLDTQLDPQQFANELFGTSSQRIELEINQNSTSNTNGNTVQGQNNESSLSALPAAIPQFPSRQTTASIYSESQPVPCYNIDEEEKANNEKSEDVFLKELQKQKAIESMQKKNQIVSQTNNMTKKQQLQDSEEDEEEEEEEKEQENEPQGGYYGNNHQERYQFRDKYAHDSDENDSSNDSDENSTPQKRMQARRIVRNQVLRQSIIQEYADEDGEMQDSTTKKAFSSAITSKKTSFIMQNSTAYNNGTPQHITNNNNNNNNSNEDEGLNKMKFPIREVIEKDIQEGELSKNQGTPQNQSEQVQLSSPPSFQNRISMTSKGNRLSLNTLRESMTLDQARRLSIVSEKHAQQEDPSFLTSLETKVNQNAAGGVKQTNSAGDGIISQVPILRLRSGQSFSKMVSQQEEMNSSIQLSQKQVTMMSTKQANSSQQRNSQSGNQMVNSIHSQEIQEQYEQEQEVFHQEGNRHNTDESIEYSLKQRKKDSTNRNSTGNLLPHGVSPNGQNEKLNHGAHQIGCTSLLDISKTESIVSQANSAGSQGKHGSAKGKTKNSSGNMKPNQSGKWSKTFGKKVKRKYRDYKGKDNNSDEEDDDDDDNNNEEEDEEEEEVQQEKSRS